MGGQSGLSELSVISWVSAFEGCPLSGVPLYLIIAAPVLHFTWYRFAGALATLCKSPTHAYSVSSSMQNQLTEVNLRYSNDNKSVSKLEYLSTRGRVSWLSSKKLLSTHWQTSWSNSWSETLILTYYFLIFLDSPQGPAEFSTTHE